VNSLERQPSQSTLGALALQDVPGTTPSTPKVVRLSRLLRELSDIERHVLARVAVHGWTHQGRIPYIAPTAHQRAIAEILASPEVKLLDAVVTLDCRQAYRLSRRGEAVARRVFRVVLMDTVIARECEFTRMRRLVRNDWETHD
jgi:hypothetical protein